MQHSFGCLQTVYSTPPPFVLHIVVRSIGPRGYTRLFKRVVGGNL